MPASRAPQSPDARLPVVIVSGLGAPRIAAVAYGLAFQNRGFDVHAAPQRLLGYGDVRKAARLVAEEVDRVREKTGAAKVHLVGMSLGGLIGLYYLKCLRGGECVDRFVSVGGPLNGSSVARLVELLPTKAVHAIAQTTPDNDLMREVHGAPFPRGVRMFSVGTHGDVMTPRASWDCAGLEPVESPHGVFPVGHWMLFTHPGNHRIVADLLLER
jgi:triacylglycerol lipase